MRCGDACPPSMPPMHSLESPALPSPSPFGFDEQSEAAEDEQSEAVEAWVSQTDLDLIAQAVDDQVVVRLHSQTDTILTAMENNMQRLLRRQNANEEEEVARLNAVGMAEKDDAIFWLEGYIQQTRPLARTASHPMFADMVQQPCHPIFMASCSRPFFQPLNLVGTRGDFSSPFGNKRDLRIELTPTVAFSLMRPTAGYIMPGCDVVCCQQCYIDEPVAK